LNEAVSPAYRQAGPLAGAGGGQYQAGDIAAAQVSAKKEILSFKEQNS
jgi:hypothetical protein